MKKTLCMLLFAIPGLIYALPDANLTWKCTISDSANLIWNNESVFKRKASNLIFDACKNESTDPESCKPDNIRCDSFLNGISTTPIWECMALDSNATPWFGDISSQRDEAALSAKAECTHKSQIPATCYMHMLTCRNRNEVQR